MSQEPLDIRVGVLLAESAAAPDELEQEDLDSDRHAEAWGNRGRHVAGPEHQVAQLGHDILHAAAQAVGHEVAVVVSGVVAGIERPTEVDGAAITAATDGGAPSINTGTFTIEDLELTFGVKVTLGAGQAVAAFLTASGEATVEVKLALSQSKH
jgi:hypothetical protein